MGLRGDLSKGKSREEGFKVTEADVRLAGYCPDCQRRLSINTN